MEMQLVLLDDQGPDWRLDERTRECGRRGIATARAALHDAAHKEEARAASATSAASAA